MSAIARGRVVIAALALVSSTLSASMVRAAEGNSKPGMSYESLRALPDWSGWWAVKVAPGEQPLGAFFRNPPPMRAADLARFQAGLMNPDVESDPLRFCRPWQFTGFNGGLAENLEFLFTPGRVTLTNETGLIRRIHTDGRALPADPDATNTGTSVGHWEGATLVVETIGLNPDARFPGPFPGAVPIGQNVRITERIAPAGADALVVDTTVVAPDVLGAPFRRTMSYVRVPGYVGREMSLCSRSDRSIDPISGKQRFDMTLPAGLPPPPKL